MHNNTIGSLAQAKSTTSYTILGSGVASTLQGTSKHTGLDYAALSIERICCDRHFGGMPIEDVVTIVRKHAPEYFV